MGGNSFEERYRVLNEIKKDDWASVLEAADLQTGNVQVLRRLGEDRRQRPLSLAALRAEVEYGEALMEDALPAPTLVKLPDGERLLSYDGASGVRLDRFLGALDAMGRTLTQLGAMAIVQDVVISCVAVQQNRPPATRDKPEWGHGEVTTSNIVVGATGSGRLLNCAFAVAGVSEADPSNMTRICAAPELRYVRGSSGAGDVYSIGVILAMCVAGTNTLLSTNVPVSQAAFEALRKLGARVDPAFGVLVQRALSANPSQRFESPAALAAELRTLGSVRDLRAGIAKIATAIHRRDPALGELLETHPAIVTSDTRALLSARSSDANDLGDFNQATENTRSEMASDFDIPPPDFASTRQVDSRSGRRPPVEQTRSAFPDDDMAASFATQQQEHTILDPQASPEAPDLSAFATDDGDKATELLDIPPAQALPANPAPEQMVEATINTSQAELMQAMADAAPTPAASPNLGPAQPAPPNPVAAAPAEEAPPVQPTDLTGDDPSEGFSDTIATPLSSLGGMFGDAADPAAANEELLAMDDAAPVIFGPSDTAFPNSADPLGFGDETGTDGGDSSPVLLAEPLPDTPAQGQDGASEGYDSSIPSFGGYKPPEPVVPDGFVLNPRQTSGVAPHPSMEPAADGPRTSTPSQATGSPAGLIADSQPSNPGYPPAQPGAAIPPMGAGLVAGSQPSNPGYPPAQPGAAIPPMGAGLIAGMQPSNPGYAPAQPGAAIPPMGAGLPAASQPSVPGFAPNAHVPSAPIPRATTGANAPLPMVASALAPPSQPAPAHPAAVPPGISAPGYGASEPILDGNAYWSEDESSLADFVPAPASSPGFVPPASIPRAPSFESSVPAAASIPDEPKKPAPFAAAGRSHAPPPIQPPPAQPASAAPPRLEVAQVDNREAAAAPPPLPKKSELPRPQHLPGLDRRPSFLRQWGLRVLAAGFAVAALGATLFIVSRNASFDTHSGTAVGPAPAKRTAAVKRVPPRDTQPVLQNKAAPRPTPAKKSSSLIIRDKESREDHLVDLELERQARSRAKGETIENVFDSAMVDDEDSDYEDEVVLATKNIPIAAEFVEGASGASAAGDDKAHALPDQPTEVLINVIPWGQVFIDGKSAGFPPVLVKDITPGPHEVTVKRMGFKTVFRRIVAKEGHRQVVHIRFKDAR